MYAFECFLKINCKFMRSLKELRQNKLLLFTKCVILINLVAQFICFLKVIFHILFFSENFLAHFFDSLRN